MFRTVSALNSAGIPPVLSLLTLRLWPWGKPFPALFKPLLMFCGSFWGNCRAEAAQRAPWEGADHATAPSTSVHSTRSPRKILPICLLVPGLRTSLAESRASPFSCFHAGLWLSTQARG